MGLENLITLTTNQNGVKPLLIKGGALKAINTNYNKKKAKLQAQLEVKHKTKSSRRLRALTHKRNCRINNYLHTASKRVIEWCLINNISTLVIGKNDQWKQGINIGKRNNQQFVNIPHARLIDLLKYKGELMGIKGGVTDIVTQASHPFWTLTHYLNMEIKNPFSQVNELREVCINLGEVS